ncbi:V-type proton ATPase subunit d2-like isoform X3 [Zingiber officinale]|uniref:V-type proton ATPase subunit d2-like isoform X3 n=1 Tax=Zingiber officinale TaxID=94328 RepID=UPI001C4BEEF5|nr:V-type proton ATPase subunit d2-like isoform X3 [Zingiber officinale]
MYGFEALTFNVHGGYLEAIVRGYRSGLLTAADYNNLCQCETLDDVKMHLSATEYGPYLQNVAILGLFLGVKGLWMLNRIYD